MKSHLGICAFDARDDGGQLAGELITLIDQLEGRGISFRALNAPMDTTTPTGRAFLQIQAAFAEMEHNIIGQRVNEGLAAARARKGGHRILEPVRDPETGYAISPVIATALCIKPRGKLTSDQARKVEALKVGSPAFTTARRLGMHFNGIMCGRKSDPLPAWIDDAIETDFVPIVRFACTLNRDIDAVRNAI